MRFSEHFDVARVEPSDDWFDVLTHTDTPLYVDPFLIWEEEGGFWGTAHGFLIDFFDIVFDLVGEAGGNVEHVSWRQASNLLLFPEPAEFRLGVAEGSPLGSGSGKGLQEDMLAGIQAAHSIGMTRIAHIETIALFQGGMGVDRISDAVCNVLKPYFIRYTKEIARRHAIPTETQMIKNAAWSARFRKWVDQKHDLPVTEIEVRRRGKIRTVRLPVLLVPHRFLRDIPVADSTSFWSWSWSEMGDKLRGDFNFDIASKVARQTKARLARANPEAVALYLKAVEGLPKEPYPIDEDPKLLVSWYERGNEIVGLRPSTAWMGAQDSEKSFEKFVGTVIEEYQHGIENDSWRLLWIGGRGAPERSAQALFRSVVVHYCKANNIDLTGESNAGRGPVDFKFSRGWEARALVEIKLVRNSKFWNGLLAQTPTYQVAERVRVAFFVAVAYSETEMSLDFQEKLRKAARLVSSAHNISVRTVLIDATPKKSASKVKDADLLDLLVLEEDDTAGDEESRD